MKHDQFLTLEYFHDNQTFTALNSNFFWPEPIKQAFFHPIRINATQIKLDSGRPPARFV